MGSRASALRQTGRLAALRSQGVSDTDRRRAPEPIAGQGQKARRDAAAPNPGLIADPSRRDVSLGKPCYRTVTDPRDALVCPQKSLTPSTNKPPVFMQASG
jgi:hypothetical protein